MLLNNGWYWDDWCLSSYEGLSAVFKGVGNPFMATFYSSLINLTTQPALFFHITTGVIEILGIVIFYKCLSLLRVNRSHTFLITLFFALLPYNLAKITMACFAYTIGFLFFLLAVLIFIYFNRKNNLIVRMLSLILFFLSFMFLPSTLVLALAFFLFMAILYQKQEVEFKLSYFKIILNKLLTWSDFMLIPFVFWIFRAVFLKPTGIYATIGYREFTINSVLLTPINLIITFVQNFLGLVAVTAQFNISKFNVLLFVVLSIGIFIFLRKYKIEQLSNGKRMLYIGVYFFIAGAFAYLMVGLTPSFDGFDSRHQILMRIGSAFLLFYLVKLIYSEKAQLLIIITIISLFIVTSISCQLQFQKSWFKQMALEKQFTQEKSLRENVNFVVIDNTLDYNEYNQFYRSYCYTGILKKTFGTQTRFAIDSHELQWFFDKNNPGDIINNAFYHMKDCKNITSYDYSLIINPGKMLLTNKQSLKMLSQYYFDKINFDNSLNKILLLKVKPYEAENRIF